MGLGLARQRQHVAVLGEQRHGRAGATAQHRIEVLQQAKAGPLQPGHHIGVALLGLLGTPLYRRFHGAQHVRCRALSHHVHGTGGLVQLLACQAQVSGVSLATLGCGKRFRFHHKASQRPCRAADRLAQLVQHPGQRPQIVQGQVDVGGEIGQRHARLRRS